VPTSETRTPLPAPHDRLGAIRSNQRDSAHFGQARNRLRQRGRVGDRRPVHHRPLRGDDANVEARGVEQIAEETGGARQQQHVEQQGADER